MKNSDVKKTPFLVKANTNSGEISQVIGPHRTLFKEGLSGSLTQLFNGASYIEAGSNVTVTSGSNGSITIASTAAGGGGGADEGASFVLMGVTASLANERALTAGTGIKVTDAGAGSTVTLSANDSVVATVSGTRFTGVVDASAGISGSLTRLSDGTSYLIAGSNVTITSASAGVTISSTGVSYALPPVNNELIITGGWFVVSAGILRSIDNSIRLESVFCVTQTYLTASLRLYDLTAAAVVPNTTIITSSMTPVYVASGPVMTHLTASNIYQIQALCEGGSLTTDFATVIGAGFVLI